MLTLQQEVAATVTEAAEAGGLTVDEVLRAPGAGQAATRLFCHRDGELPLDEFIATHGRDPVVKRDLKALLIP